MFSRNTPVSPLTHLGVEENTSVQLQGVEICEIPFLGQFIVRFQADDETLVSRTRRLLGFNLNLNSNRFTIKDDILFAWLGPDERLVLAPHYMSYRVSDVLDELVEDILATKVDVSNAQTTIRVRGPKGVDLLSRGINYDLQADHFQPNDCVQTIMAKVPVILLNHESEILTIDLIVKRSYAEFLWKWLLDAGKEAKFDLG